MATKTDRILSYLPGTFQTIPPGKVLQAVVDAFGGELLRAENTLAEVMSAHWVDFADLNADAVKDLQLLAALYGLAARQDEDGNSSETVEEFRDHLKRYVRTFLEGTVTVQGILRVTAEALGLHIADDYKDLDTWWNRPEQEARGHRAGGDAVTRGHGETALREGFPPQATANPKGDAESSLPITHYLLPIPHDATSLIFGVKEINARGSASLPAQVKGNVKLGAVVNLEGANRLQLKVDNCAPVTIDLLEGVTNPATVGAQQCCALEDIVNKINTSLNATVGAQHCCARIKEGYLLLTSPSEGTTSTLEVQDISNDAAECLLGLAPRVYRGSDATTAQVTGGVDLSGGLTLQRERYLRLLIDNRYLAEIDVTGGSSALLTLDRICDAINNALGINVASHNNRFLTLTSPSTGSGSTIALQQPAAGDATTRLFGAIASFYLGEDAKAARLTGKRELTRGIDLSAASNIRLQIDDRPAVNINCAGANPANTQPQEIINAINTALAVEVATYNGQFITLTSPTRGATSRIVLETPPTSDTTGEIFGIGSRIFQGANASAARVGAQDSSAPTEMSLEDGVDLRAQHRIQIAVDDKAPVEINLRSHAENVGKVTLAELQAAINLALGFNVANHDGRHLILVSPTIGKASAIAIAPLEQVKHRRFVTRATIIDEASQKVFGFVERHAQGTAATRAKVIGKIDLSHSVDLRSTRFLRMSIDGQAPQEIDFATHPLIPRPRAAMLKDIVAAINDKFGGEIASDRRGRGEWETQRRGESSPRPRVSVSPCLLQDGKQLILTSPSEGASSNIAFFPPRGADGAPQLLSVEPGTFRGEDAQRVVFVGTVDLSDGVTLPANAAINLSKDGGAFVEITLALGKTTISDIVAKINERMGIFASHDGKYIILSSSQTGEASRIEFAQPSGTDVTQAIFGINAPRSYRGVNAKPAQIIGTKDLSNGVDLRVARFLKLSAAAKPALEIDLAAGITNPVNVKLEDIVNKINSAITDVRASHDGRYLTLTSVAQGNFARLELLPYTAGDARSALLGDVPEAVKGSDSLPATITGEVDLVAPVNLSERGIIRLSVNAARPVDIDITGDVVEQTFLDEMVAKINAVFPGMASATQSDRLQLTAPTTGEDSQLSLLALRYLELIEYPAEPVEKTFPVVQHGQRISLVHDGKEVDAIAEIKITAPEGVVSPTLVNETLGWQIRLLTVLAAGETARLWWDANKGLQVEIITPNGERRLLSATDILVGRIDTGNRELLTGNRTGDSGLVTQDWGLSTLTIPPGKSQWIYLDCYGSRFNQANFNNSYFPGGLCTERGVFNVSHFVSKPPGLISAVFAGSDTSKEPGVKIVFNWMRHRLGAFTVNLPADLPSRFGGKFNEARFSSGKDEAEVYLQAVTEPPSDDNYLVNLINMGTTVLCPYESLVTASEVERVPLGWQPIIMPFRKPQFLTLGRDIPVGNNPPQTPGKDGYARIYIKEKDGNKIIELKAKEPGAWGNKIAVSVRQSAPAMYDVSISYNDSYFENAKAVVLGGEEIPALTEKILQPGAIGILQAKAAGVKATVTRE